MADIETQLRRLYQDHGMEPKEISRNNKPATGYWRVSVQADGSAEQYHRQTTEIGSEKPTDYNLDFTAVKTATTRQIDGSRIPAGTVNLEEIVDEYAHLTIDDD